MRKFISVSSDVALYESIIANSTKNILPIAINLLQKNQFPTVDQKLISILEVVNINSHLSFEQLQVKFYSQLESFEPLISSTINQLNKLPKSDDSFAVISSLKFLLNIIDK